jgi:hypothetical protein
LRLGKLSLRVLVSIGKTNPAVIGLVCDTLKVVRGVSESYVEGYSTEQGDEADWMNWIFKRSYSGYLCKNMALLHNAPTPDYIPEKDLLPHMESLEMSLISSRLSSTTEKIPTDIISVGTGDAHGRFLGTDHGL